MHSLLRGIGYEVDMLYDVRILLDRVQAGVW